MRVLLISVQALVLAAIAIVGATSGAQDAKACAVTETHVAGHCELKR